ncbi:fungal specific transcription factor domain-containing protein [Aspergillus affinis]|uniref:fungal specific transcription factor domain-containing protein n=1 Tax=Aspergillus affinis TaxID=1070780 RepID=UPI0022FDBA84|nr:C6 finger domain protein [Aspergillus affinis]KAI9039868.1 C6 finger domain protein [Aspergillus affinis]
MTAAHQLLEWPLIKQLLLPKEYDKDYVMMLEEDRGLIFACVPGEGDNTDNDMNALPPIVTPAENGLHESGYLTADSQTLHRYHRSYIEHIHQLHPFLHQTDLETKVGQFIDDHCPQSVSDLSSRASQINGSHIERSIVNAIVLLVFAIGSICEAPLVSGSTMDNQDGQASASERLHYLDAYHLTNPNPIPGLAYYGYATQILGSLQGANGLLHVQAALLAGIYAGQLVHPLQSYGWIHQAARSCQVLVRK